VQGRASKHYNYFIDTFLLYQSIFDNTGDLVSILNLPYPLYHDVILKQVEEKKKEKSKIDQKLKNQKIGK
jgi:hypothetical protein